MPQNHYYGEDRRSNPVLTKDDLKDVIDKTMEKHLLSDQHQFVAALIKKEERKQELWEKVKAHVVGWGAVAVIVFFVNSFWQDILSLLALRGKD